jgi:hypothetical protein
MNSMLTEEEYQAKLKRLEELMVDDPHPADDAGKELLALADEIEDYERVRFPEFAKKNA